MSTAAASNPVLSTTRRALSISRFGDTDVFVPSELDLPALGSRELLIRVAAAAVNPVDLSTRAGRNIPAEVARFPMVLGWDVAGTVVETGTDVFNLEPGARVAAMTFQPLDQNGTYADLVVLDADLVVPVPDGLDLVEASTMPLAGLTATQLLVQAALPAGAVVMVDGALGAVGALVVQLAYAAGLRVVAVVRSHRLTDALALGAAEALSPAELSARLGSVDGAIDLVGGPLAHQLLATVVDGGSYVTSVPPYIDSTGPFEPTRGINPAVLTVAPNRDQLTALLHAAADRRIATPIDRTFPLSQAAEAHAHVAAGHLHGKVVLLP